MTTMERMKKREAVLLFFLYRSAFPAAERKPFRKILGMAREGKADLWTIRRSGRFAGFAATVNAPALILLDYFAVKKSLRGQGVGTDAMGLLKEVYRDRGLFVEIESASADAVNLLQRQKRKEFYCNCGLRPMGTEADVFGVRMELLGIRCHLNFEEYRAFYRDYYSPWAARHIREVQT